MTSDNIRTVGEILPDTRNTVRIEPRERAKAEYLREYEFRRCKRHQPRLEDVGDDPATWIKCPPCPECQREKREAEYAKQMNTVPPKYRAADIPPALRPRLTGLLGGDGPKTVYLWGGPGCGKTWTAYAVLKERWKAGLEGRYTTGAAFAKDLQLAAAQGGDEEVYVIVEQSNGAGLLVIDDVTWLKVTDFVRMDVHEILSQREAWDRPTLVIGNADTDSLAAQISDPIASRLSQCSIQLTGPDRRLEKK